MLMLLRIPRIFLEPEMKRSYNKAGDYKKYYRTRFNLYQCAPCTSLDITTGDETVSAWARLFNIIILRRATMKEDLFYSQVP